MDEKTVYLSLSLNIYGLIKKEKKNPGLLSALNFYFF